MLPDLFRKLKPLYGKGIDLLWIEYQTADVERKREIEEYLMLLGVKHLGLAIGDRPFQLASDMGAHGTGRRWRSTGSEEKGGDERRGPGAERHVTSLRHECRHACRFAEKASRILHVPRGR